MTRPQKTIFTLALVLLAASVTLPVFSAGLLDLPQFQDPCDVCEFARLLSQIKNIVFEIAAPAALLFVIIGGVMFSASAGIPNQVKRAKQIITSAIIGLVIVICAWLIVSAVMAATLGQDIGSSWWTVTCPEDNTCKYQAANPNPPPTTPVTPPPAGGGRMDPDRALASPRLAALMDCMSQKVPANEYWHINSIMDYEHAECNASNKGNPLHCEPAQCTRCGGCPIDDCANSSCYTAEEEDKHKYRCSHGPGCHYGGPNCSDGSYAVDISNKPEYGATSNGLQAAVDACGGGWVFGEATHFHVSIGRLSGCGCDK